MAKTSLSDPRLQLRLLGIARTPRGIDPGDLCRTLTHGGYLCTIPEGVSRAKAQAEMRARGKVLALWVWRRFPERVEIGPVSTECRRKLVLTPLPVPQPPPPPEPKYVVYIDGCCEPNPSANLGIGVHSDDVGIHISERVDLYGTNNVAECLAAIRALEECRRRGLKDVRLLSDSLLLVNWVRGRYKMRSETAHAYVPKIRALLKQVRGTIVWVPSHRNLADGPSREAIGAHQESAAANPLSVVINTPMDRLKFRHFMRLRSGRDQYTAMRLDRLRSLVPDHTRVAESLADGAEQAKCLRWMLRGLDLAKALRKVGIDREVGANYRRRRGGFEGRED